MRKTYIAEIDRGKSEYKPTFKAYEIFNFYHIKITDYVVLTPDQYRDYQYVLNAI